MMSGDWSKITLMDNAHWKRFIYWLGYNVLIASLPLIMIWVLRGLSDKPAVEQTSDLPEMLFFVIIACISTVSDIKTRKDVQADEIKFLILEIALIFGSVASAIVYGGIRFAVTSNPKYQIQSTAFELIFASIICLFITSLVTQIFIVSGDIAVTGSVGEVNTSASTEQ